MSDLDCPYGVQDPRFDAWLEGYQAALRWMRDQSSQPDAPEAPGNSTNLVNPAGE